MLVSRLFEKDERMYSFSVLVALLVIGGLALCSFVVLPLQPLTTPLPSLDDDQRASALRLEAHVRGVASVPHNIEHFAALEDTARYIEATLRGYGAFPISAVYDAGGQSVRNIEVIFEPAARGSKVQNSGTLVVGAHYDSADDSPGAHDNGTGVAALLELARDLCRSPEVFTSRLRLVFFVNEEQPYGKTDNMGSLRHARQLHASGEHVTGMIALETLGYFSNKPGSQKLPAPFKWLYPDRGNFVAFIGLPGSRAFLARAVRHFRAAHVFPSTGTIAPAWIEGADHSDHWAYHHMGVPAIMITDTAPYRNPFYHQVWDTPDTVDYESLARIVSGLRAMTRDLACART